MVRFLGKSALAGAAFALSVASVPAGAQDMEEVRVTYERKTPLDLDFRFRR